jgi:hypothetical protein
LVKDLEDLASLKVSHGAFALSRSRFGFRSTFAGRLASWERAGGVTWMRGRRESQRGDGCDELISVSASGGWWMVLVALES